MAESDCLHTAVLVTSPGVHGHRVGVIHEDNIGLGHFAYIFTEIEHGRDGSLCVHDPTGAQCVADTLIDAVLKRDFDIGLERFKAALPNHTDDIVGIGNGRSTVESRFDRCR